MVVAVDVLGVLGVAVDVCGGRVEGDETPVLAFGGEL